MRKNGFRGMPSPGKKSTQTIHILMSEIHNHKQKTRESITRFCLGMLRGEKGGALINQYEEDIQNVTPRDVIFAVDQMVRESDDMDLLKKSVSKSLNVLFQPLSRFEWKYGEDSFFALLVKENREMDRRLKALKEDIKKLNSAKNEEKIQLLREKMRTKIGELREYEKHYVKKENILFPYVEKKMPDYRCLKIMWSIHDDVRDSLNHLEHLLSQKNTDLTGINSALGKLFFGIYPVIFREEYILFPAALEILNENDLEEMLEQSYEEGFSFFEIKDKKEQEMDSHQQEKETPGLADLGTGKLTHGQIKQILEVMPTDLTFVDENDEVLYFSGGKDRVFPRSKAVIGRKVQNCHPQESVHMVEEILERFRSGSSDIESFWINMKGKFILIQYYAVRDDKGKYMGTLEFSQDATWIRKLEGEKRLLSGN